MTNGETTELRLRFAKFRILYTSFVRCMRYLARIKDDAINGRPPSVIDYAATLANDFHNISSNQNLQMFLARARVVQKRQRAAAAQQQVPQEEHIVHDASSDEDDVAPAAAAPAADRIPVVAAAARTNSPIDVADDGSSTAGGGGGGPLATTTRPKKRQRGGGNENNTMKRKKPKYGTSMLTRRVLLPAATGETGNHELPWSCAIYSIVIWMVGLADVEGIQTMCLKVLPFLLEDEQQRTTAQRAGLTDIVLRDMVMFPDSPQLHTAAFHTIVLLARPLGGREGMLFHTSMVNSSGTFNSRSSNGNHIDNGATNNKNGIAVMLDSMRRFPNNEALQAMSCWSLVNIALAPAQKDVLVKLGGIEVITNAMVAHPHSAEVQFRALFALINLVIPRVGEAAVGGDAAATAAGDNDDGSTAKEILDEMVEQIVKLVVRAMKTFCSSESILNRACLVLHNLSLRQEYHGPLLWTRNCYQMLEWCMSNYRTDQVLQQSLAGTLHRLQLTLSSSANLRARFNAALAAEQQTSLEQAHREAKMLHEQYDRHQHQQQQARSLDK
jgi:hypothetical protein